MRKTNNGNQNIFEIFRDMMLSIERPDEVNMNNDIIDHFKTFPNKNQEILTTVFDTHGVIDYPKFLETYSTTFNCPIIYYSKKRTDNDTAAIITKLRKFLEVNGLTGKHLITFNFPCDKNELLRSNSAGFSPNNVVKVMPILSKELKEVSGTEKNNYKNLEEVEAYYKRRTTSLTLTNNVEEDCHRLKTAIDLYRFAQTSFQDLRISPQRIMLLGQIGSGRKTQATLLAKRCHLVFLDFRVLLLDYARSNKTFDRLLSKAKNVRRLDRRLIALILFKRITQADCLKNGWVLVGYVSSVAAFKILEKEFFITPKKIVFLHCRQSLCLDRLRLQITKNADVDTWCCSSSDVYEKYAELGFLNLFNPSSAVSYVINEMDHFCQHREAILKYHKDQVNYIMHVDGEHSVPTVATLLWGQLDKFNL